MSNQCRCPQHSSAFLKPCYKHTFATCCSPDTDPVSFVSNQCRCSQHSSAFLGPCYKYTLVTCCLLSSFRSSLVCVESVPKPTALLRILVPCYKYTHSQRVACSPDSDPVSFVSNQCRCPQHSSAFLEPCYKHTHSLRVALQIQIQSPNSFRSLISDRPTLVTRTVTI